MFVEELRKANKDYSNELKEKARVKELERIKEENDLKVAAKIFFKDIQPILIEEAKLGRTEYKLKDVIYVNKILHHKHFLEAEDLSPLLKYFYRECQTNGLRVLVTQERDYILGTFYIFKISWW